MMSPLQILRPLAAGAVIALLAALTLHAQSVDELIARGRSERDAGRFEAATALFRRASETDPNRADALLLLAETLAWQKNFAEAEASYRRAIDRFGATREAHLGLGRVLLWSGEYAEARRLFSSLLEADPGDADAREERARAFYWSGDFRAAAREFRRVVELDPARAESRRALDEIRLASSPAYAVRAFHRSDDQPVRIQRAAVDLTLFSDPLTRWTVSAGSWRLGDAGDDAPFFGVETDVPIPSLRLTVAPSLRIFSFPDGEEEILGGLRVARNVGASSSISAAVQRDELLLSAGAADDHPFVTEAFVQYDVATARGLLARARAGSSSFYDGNDGTFADGYVLAPLGRTERVTISAGISAAYRDTDASRFRFERVDVAGPTVDGFSYRWRGVYEPYWTPLGLRELRAIASAGSPPGSRILWNLQVTGGYARDRGVSFGPSRGSDARPPAPFASEYSRGWNPWTAMATLEVPVAGSRLRFDYEHARTIDYEADEFRAALVGRF